VFAERKNLLADPRRYVLQRVGICKQHPGTLQMDVEHGQVDELRPAGVGSMSDRTRERLLTRLRKHRHDLTGLHVGAKAHGKLGEGTDEIGFDAHRAPQQIAIIGLPRLWAIYNTLKYRLATL
jgi:hypothetical protein